jgi:hypothetical protein
MLNGPLQNDVNFGVHPFFRFRYKQAKAKNQIARKIW